MHNFKIGFDFVKHFLKSNFFNDETLKVMLFKKYKSIFTFNGTGLDTQRFDKKKKLYLHNPI